MSFKQTAITMIQKWDSQLKKFFSGEFRYLKIIVMVLVLVISVSLINNIVNWFLWILISCSVGALAYLRDQPPTAE